MADVKQFMERVGDGFETTPKSAPRWWTAPCMGFLHVHWTCYVTPGSVSVNEESYSFPIMHFQTDGSDASPRTQTC